jgi:hypothetical protein
VRRRGLGSAVRRAVARWWWRRSYSEAAFRNGERGRIYRQAAQKRTMREADLIVNCILMVVVGEL